MKKSCSLHKKFDGTKVRLGFLQSDISYEIVLCATFSTSVSCSRQSIAEPSGGQAVAVPLFIVSTSTLELGARTVVVTLKLLLGKLYTVSSCFNKV